MAPPRARPLLALVAALALAALGGCGGGSDPAGSHTATETTRSTATIPAARPEPAKLRPCHGLPAFSCGWVTVPLDRRTGRPGRLRLRVAAQDGAGRRWLLVLTGGPGQPGVPLIAKAVQRLGIAARGYRLVAVDQRGTGAGALRCPALQTAMGASDVRHPPTAAVDACARGLGAARDNYATADTVADLDAVRRALGIRRWAILGTSYGTFVAERYAIAQPKHVTGLVLDSVVPHTGADLLYREALARTGPVLREVCRTSACPGDPAVDLAAAVRRRGDGPAILDAITAYSIVAPGFPGVARALHDAARGRDTRLDRLIRGVRRGEAVPAGVLSQGLHAATLCADSAAPWGAPTAGRSERDAAVRLAARELRPDEVAPYDPRTAIDQGLVATCRRWPAMRAAPPPVAADLPDVPALLLAGQRDLSTPLSWAREELRHAPKGKLVIVPRIGHSTLGRDPGGVARRSVASFLEGLPV